MLLLSCTFWLQNLSGVWLPALSPTWNCFPSFSHYLTTSLHGLRCHLFSLKLFLSQFLTLSLTKSSPLYEAVVTSFTHVDKEALCSILSIIFGAISSCLKKQMAEFLPGGTYSSSFSSEDVSSTAGSSLTNLTCERQFGSLDFSLKRRRHASLHYHTTHLLLKSNLSSLSDWLQSKDLVEQLHLWTQAKKAGPYLRKKHQESQIKTVVESFHHVEATTVATLQSNPQRWRHLKLTSS